MDEYVGCVEMLNVRSWVRCVRDDSWLMRTTMLRCVRDTGLVLAILPMFSVLSGMLSVRWHIVYRVLMQQERPLLDGGGGLVTI